MTCPDSLTTHQFVVLYLLDFAQAVAVVVVWEVVKLLWRHVKPIDKPWWKV